MLPGVAALCMPSAGSPGSPIMAPGLCPCARHRFCDQPRATFSKRVLAMIPGLRGKAAPLFLSLWKVHFEHICINAGHNISPRRPEKKENSICQDIQPSCPALPTCFLGPREAANPPGPRRRGREADAVSDGIFPQFSGRIILSQI